MSAYHEREFKVVTVKGTFFYRKSQTVEDGNEYLENKTDEDKLRT